MGLKSLISALSVAVASYFLFSNVPLSLSWNIQLSGVLGLLLGVFFGVLIYIAVEKFGDEIKVLITSIGIMVSTFFVSSSIEFPWGIEIPNFVNFILGILFGAVSYTILSEIYKSS